MLLFANDNSSKQIHSKMRLWANINRKIDIFTHHIGKEATINCHVVYCYQWALLWQLHRLAIKISHETTNMTPMAPSITSTPNLSFNYSYCLQSPCNFWHKLPRASHHSLLPAASPTTSTSIPIIPSISISAPGPLLLPCCSHLAPQWVWHRHHTSLEQSHQMSHTVFLTSVAA